MNHQVGLGVELKTGRILKICWQTLLALPQPHSVSDFSHPTPDSAAGRRFFGEIEEALGWGTPGTMEEGLKQGCKQRDLHPGHQSQDHRKGQRSLLWGTKGPPKDEICQSSNKKTSLQLSNSVVKPTTWQTPSTHRDFHQFVSVMGTDRQGPPVKGP